MNEMDMHTLHSFGRGLLVFIFLGVFFERIDSLPPAANAIRMTRVLIKIRCDVYHCLRTVH